MSDENPPASPPKFSILLATVENRAALFAVLHDHLKKQAVGKPVEILVACDNKEISIGKKRQNLLEQATGDYCAFIDDDDWVADDYVDRMLEAASANMDCIGFRIECTSNGGSPVNACTSIKYKEWGDNIDGYRYVRSPYHKSGIRRNLALQVGFRDMRYGEDKVFSDGITKLVTTEQFIDHVMYYYRFKTEPFAEKYGFKNMPITGPDRRNEPGVDYNYVRPHFHR